MEVWNSLEAWASLHSAIIDWTSGSLLTIFATAFAAELRELITKKVPLSWASFRYALISVRLTELERVHQSSYQLLLRVLSYMYQSIFVMIAVLIISYLWSSHLWIQKHGHEPAPGFWVIEWFAWSVFTVSGSVAIQTARLVFALRTFDKTTNRLREKQEELEMRLQTGDAS